MASDNQSLIHTKDGKVFDIPEGGSLGLLALGYRGLMLWRQKRNELAAEQKESTKESERKNEEE